jgi:hypothetical protein
MKGLIMREAAKTTGTIIKVSLITTTLASGVCNSSFARENLRDWINNNLGKLGSVIAEPKSQQNNSQMYYFQTTATVPNSTFPVIVTIACTQTKEPGALCTTSSTTGAPSGFPSAFKSPVYP